jgi:hypothetical protein
MSPNGPRPSTATTRRRLLAGSSAALATALSPLTAGCLSALPPLGEGQRYGRLGTPPVDAPAYRRWLPAPSTVELSAAEYHLSVHRPGTAPPGAPAQYVARRAHSRAATDYFGVGFDAYDRHVDSALGTVVEASFDREDVVETVTGSGYDLAGDALGYDVYERMDVHRRVAVGEDVVVWTSAYHHDSPDLRALLEAGAGERPRYHERDAPFRRLSAAAGGNPALVVSAGVHDPTGRQATVADATRFDADYAYQVVHYGYGDGGAPGRTELEAALREERYRFLDGAEGFDVSVGDDVATVETRVPLHPDREPDPQYDLPQTTWGVDRDGSTLRFVHEAGDPVPAARLFYDVDTAASPAELTRRPLWRGLDTVGPGDAATVDLREHPDATEASLVYSTGGVSFHVLFGVGVGGGDGA